MRALALALMLVCAPAVAGVFAHSVTMDGRTLNLHDEPCELAGFVGGKVELISPTGALMFRGCWKNHSAMPAIIIDWEDSDKSLVLKRAFRPGPKPGGT